MESMDGRGGAEGALARTLREVRLGRIVSYGPLHLFPLLGGPVAEGAMELLDEAVEAGTLRFEELDDGGSVPELRVVNSGERSALILEGDELSGFKQNRVVNSSVLVGARSELALPVSCVEQGRWSRRSRPFFAAEASSHLSLRRLKSRAVHDSLKSGRGHRSDQSAVWEEVDRLSKKHSAPSPTRALQDTRIRLAEKFSGFTDLARKMPEGARGVVAGLDGRPVSLEILAGPRSFSKVFARLLSGYALEALERSEAQGPPDPFAAGEFIEAALSAEPQEHPAVGAGRDFRLESPGVSGYALTDASGLLHTTIFAERFAERFAQRDDIG